MTESHYRANLRDIEFDLFELLERGKLLGVAPYEDLDEDTARSILSEVERLAVERLAPSLADGDRNPPVFDPATASVTMPESFKRSYRAYRDAEWWRLDLPPQLNGQPCPRSIRWGVGEMVLGANAPVHMYACGPSFAVVIDELGTPDQKTLAATMTEAGWGATMVLTEPDAGSDVGAGRTRAIPQDDGSWHIEGVKRFITSAEHDLADNIVHLVLARPVGAGPGTKGLSMFIVPKFNCDWETGELRERNGVRVTNVEHKMGLKVSTTCELTFGADTPAVGYLLGEVHDGIAQMFRIIQDARMMVGMKAIGTLSTGYLNALDYAKQRVQGADLVHNADKSSPRVTITHHPDVRRLLMLQKSYAEGLRALALFASSVQDDSIVVRATGTDDNEVIELEHLYDLMLPIIKGVGSEKSYELLSSSLQVLGGSGYLQDYPIEQYIRDAKIDTLYEGTTAIQGQDLFFRKIVRDEGRSLTRLLMMVGAFVKDEDGDESFAGERDALGKALADTQKLVELMVGDVTAAQQDPARLYRVGENTTRLLMVLGDLLVAWLLLRSAEIAGAALRRTDISERDRDFYTGKVAAARFFAAAVLPGVGAARRAAEAVDGSLMGVPESAF
jgi:alkylation response protein AidB-like acyl-CoA dehydrogenase